MVRILLFLMLLQVLLIIHVVRTGRKKFWIYLLIFLPYVGGIAYVVVELIPSFFSSRNMDRMAGSFGDLINPGSRLSKLEKQADHSPTFKNISAIGDEYLNMGRYADAAAAYKRCLKPPFDENNAYLYRMAFAQYKCQEFALAEQVMRRIGDMGGGRFKAQELLLFAKIQEGQDDQAGARRLYEEASYKTGELTYGYEFAAYLKRTGDIDSAYSKFSLIIDTYGRLPRRLKKHYRHVIADINKEMADLTAASTIIFPR